VQTSHEIPAQADASVGDGEQLKKVSLEFVRLFVLPVLPAQTCERRATAEPAAESVLHDNTRAIAPGVLENVDRIG
jgi:hypothetical protein